MLATKTICKLRRKYYFLIDSIVGYKRARWLFTLSLLAAYFYRCIGMSYDVISYLLGFYVLQLVVGYFTPKGLVEVEDEEEVEPLSEVFESGGNKPLVSEVNEFQIW